MKINILVVSGIHERRDALVRLIGTGCDKLDLNLAGIFSKNNSASAIEKIDQTELNAILCDSSILDWRKISNYFKKKGGNKIFLLVVYDRLVEVDYDDPAVDGQFCANKLREGRESACDTIAQMLYGRYPKRTTTCQK